MDIMDIMDTFWGTPEYLSKKDIRIVIQDKSKSTPEDSSKTDVRIVYPSDIQGLSTPEDFKAYPKEIYE